MNRSNFLSAIVAALCMFPANGLAAEPQSFEPSALQADLHFAIDTIERQHPRLEHSVSRKRLQTAVASIRTQLSHRMSQGEAWAVMAQLNPLLADGHLFISLPNWRAQTTDDVRQGVGFFPFEVELDGRGYPVVTAKLGGAATPFAGRRITWINGQDAHGIGRTLLARMHGDTPAFRAALLSQRWWLGFAQLYGRPSFYDLRFAGSQTPHRIMAEHVLPAILQQEQSFERLFSCDIKADHTAKLTIASFAWQDKSQFFQFTHDCFARIKATSAQQLIIDVSANSGGDDDMWKEGILHYIATKPYKQGSTYVKRERDGSLSTGEIATATDPALNEPLHFNGKVEVLIGPLTYSSAVLFSNVVRDYGLGTLTGIGNAARTEQSGGVQSVTLPNTGLLLFYPRFVLAPPSRGTAPRYLRAAVGNNPDRGASTGS
ncbi:S41 family peptidase [Sphingobium sp. WTD-1]|uniref:S41 family peptidase n=1 Tax=Sphingobium sp. WTD-1 TaxID=2979467 RepID=UPI0024DE951B|nr:S41 family peptidase [Sphingobium sp. WTD-1]WIA57667.1 S41 family peptidase [Sphingobium sp. WTD-1]